MEDKYEKLERLSKLKEKGIISEEEFEKEKKEILFPKKISEKLSDKWKDIKDGKSSEDISEDIMAAMIFFFCILILIVFIVRVLV